MTAFIILFRGVGGGTQLPVARLREALTEAGFAKVATYINSGNAVLSSGHDASTTRARIAAIVKGEFGFEKDIMIMSRSDWARLIDRNPFPEAVDEPTALHAFVLTGLPTESDVAALVARTTGRERVVVDGTILYFHAPDGFGTSKLPPVIDRTLRVTSTARNWRTVQALMKLSREI